MAQSKPVVKVGKIQQRILLVRGEKVIVRAFVTLRRTISGHKELAQKLTKLERKLADHDDQIIAIIEAIKKLSSPQPVPKKRRIGFHPE